MTTEYIEVSKLVKSTCNVRKTVSKTADKELKASILAHGLMQNLVVTDAGDGTYRVIAGARRLAALQELIEKEKLPAGHAVPCQVAPEQDAAEMSLAENTVRQAMHPMDEFEAFVALAGQGEKPEQIAKRFGATARHVQQRLRLGRVAPAIREAYRDEKLNLDALMAYALTDDQARQMRVFESLKHGQHEYSIRRALTETMVEAGSKLARFVGLEAYQAAGGTVKADLFGEDVYLEDVELVSRLAGEKLEAEAEKLRQEGWGWVGAAEERDYRLAGQCDRIRPVPLDVPQELIEQMEAAEAEQTRIATLLDETDFSAEPAGTMERLEAEEKAIEAKLSEIEEKIESCSGFGPDQMKTAGCYVTIGYRGELQVDKGLVRPEDRKKSAMAKAMSGDQEEPEEPKAKLSDSLRRDLAAYRLQVAQAEIAMNPGIAFDLLVFHVATGVLGNLSPHDGPDVLFRQSYPRPGVEAETLAAKRLEAIVAGLPVEWLRQEDEASRFAAFCDLTDGDKHRLLAYCTALTLKPKLGADGGRTTAYDIALSRIGDCVAEYWRPTKANYFGRVAKDQLLEIGRELIGGERGDQWAKANAKEKKGDIADELHRHFAAGDGEASTTATPEQIERLRNWLPEGMAFPSLPEPTPAKAKGRRKAA